MKPILFTAVFVTLVFAYECRIFAQTPPVHTRYTARETYLQDDSIMLTANRYMPALSVYIPETDAMYIRKAWERKLKKGIKSKFTHHHNVFFLPQTLFEEVSLMPLNVYTSYTQQNKDTKLTVALELDSGFLSPSFMLDNYTNARSLLRTFGVQQYRASIINTLKKEKRTLRQMTQQMEKLFTENKQLKALIKKREMGIINFKDAIKEHNMLIDMKTQDVVASTQALGQYSGELRKEKDKELRNIKRQRKQLQRKAKRMAKNIAHYKGDIRQAKHTIDLNLSKQKLQKDRVREQQDVVEQLKNVEKIVEDME